MTAWKTLRIDVTRNLRPLTSLDQGKDSTLFFVGTDLRGANTIPLEEAQALDRFMTTGGRVVVTLMPAVTQSSNQKEGSEKKKARTDSKTSNPQEAKPKDSQSGGGVPDIRDDIPGAELPVKNGPTANELKEALEVMFEYPNLMGFGIASYPWRKDKDRKGLKSVFRLVEGVIAGVKNR